MQPLASDLVVNILEKSSDWLFREKNPEHTLKFHKTTTGEVLPVMRCFVKTMITSRHTTNNHQSHNHRIECIDATKEYKRYQAPNEVIKHQLGAGISRLGIGI